MKNTVKQLAAGTFISLLILVGNFKAEATELKASGLEIIETGLQLENWMTDETIWNTNSFYHVNSVQETETSLELESWMTSENTWSLNNNFVAETEPGMELESWMLSEDIWNDGETDVEAELVLESWMVNSEVWK